MDKLTMNMTLEAMNAEIPEQIDVHYDDFVINCNVRLTLAAQLSLVEQTIRNCAEVQDVNMGRSPLFRRAMLEGLYVWNHTNAASVLGIDDDVTQEKLTRLCNVLNIVEILSDMDVQYGRMFSDIMASVDWRSAWAEQLVAANLANQKLNEVLSNASQIVTAFSGLAEQLDGLQSQEQTQE